MQLDHIGENNGPTAVELDLGPASGLAGVADAFVRVDLETGTISLGGSATTNPGFGYDQIASTADGQFTDMLLFNLPDGLDSVEIPFVMQIEGTFSAGSGCQSFVRASLGSTTVSAQPHHADCGAVFGQTLTGSTIVQSGAWVLVDGYMTAGIGNSGFFDARNTTFSLTLPAGVTFESASGVFLAPVPEPGSLLLAATGLCGAAARHFRSRRRSNAPRTVCAGREARRDE